MHPIHDAAVRPQDDRVARIDLVDESRMLDHRSNRWPLHFVKPVDRINLVDRLDLDLLDGEFLGELDQPVDVPGVDSAPDRARP